MRITKRICDKCLSEDLKKETEATKRIGFKHGLIFDLCEDHAKEIQNVKSEEELRGYIYGADHRK